MDQRRKTSTEPGCYPASRELNEARAECFGNRNNPLSLLIRTLLSLGREASAGAEAEATEDQLEAEAIVHGRYRHVIVIELFE